MITKDFMSLLREQKVVIPQIQRDYAQGRTTDEVTRIRDRFLDKLCEVLQDLSLIHISEPTRPY